MGSSLWSIYVVYKAVNTFRIGIIVLHGNLYEHSVLRSFTVNHIAVKGHLTLV